MKWISVKDRLPEYKTYIVTFVRSTCDHDVRTWDVNYYTEDCVLEGNCFRCKTKMDCYWMPMPEDPHEMD